MMARGSRDGMDGASLALLHQMFQATDDPRRTSSIDELLCIAAQVPLQRGPFEQVAHESGQPIRAILRTEIHGERGAAPDERGARHRSSVVVGHDSLENPVTEAKSQRTGGAGSGRTTMP